MNKYKVCLSCSEKNNPIQFECANCGFDLTSVAVVDEETEKAFLKQVVVKESEPVFRMCGCGTKNPPSLRKCTNCGEDISDILHTTDEACNQKNGKFLLQSVDGKYAYEIKEDVTLIGREQEMKDYLSSKQFVSRSHARITITADELFIENLSTTNFTYINNLKVPANEQIKLNDGDEIGLGGVVKDEKRQDGAAYFIARINQCI